VDSFDAMRSEADRIALLASSAEAPLEDDATVSPASVATWREIASAARSLDRWAWDATSTRAPLTLREAAVISAATPLTADIRTESGAVAGVFSAPPSALDAPPLEARMDRVAQTASTVARALTPLATCEVGSAEAQVSYAMPRNCDTLDPQYQVAMMGPCRY
jgi:hypothetical protein